MIQQPVTEAAFNWQPLATLAVGILAFLGVWVGIWHSNHKLMVERLISRAREDRIRLQDAYSASVDAIYRVIEVDMYGELLNDRVSKFGWLPGLKPIGDEIDKNYHEVQSRNLATTSRVRLIDRNRDRVDRLLGLSHLVMSHAEKGSKPDDWDRVLESLDSFVLRTAQELDDEYNVAVNLAQRTVLPVKAFRNHEA